jgi:hypothetical protein
MDFGEHIMEARKWSLIENGTAALIFHCKGADCVRWLLNMVQESLMETFERYWYEYLNQAHHTDRNRIFYVKVKTRATNRRFFNQNPGYMVFYAQSVEDHDIVKTYPIVPVQHGKGYFVRGCL